MPVHSLPVMRGRRLQAWETVRNLLMRDSELRRLGVLWQTPDDTDFDNPPPTDKVVIRLDAKLGQAERFTMTGWSGTDSVKPLSITYEISVPGGEQDNFENMAKVSDAVERCLCGRWNGQLPAQPAEYQAHWKTLQNGGVDDLEVAMSADYGQPGVIDVTVYEAS